MTLIDEINRLFDELVRSPWSRPQGVIARETYVDLEIPLAGGPLGDVSVSLQGRRLSVRASSAGVPEASIAPHETERSLVLPERAAVSAIEARVEDEVLRVRIRLSRVG